MENKKITVTFIDPPSGWKYGFPKPIPDKYRRDAVKFLKKNGYPKSLIDDFGEYFYCRYYEKEILESELNIWGFNKEDFIKIKDKPDGWYGC